MAADARERRDHAVDAQWADVGKDDDAQDQAHRQRVDEEQAKRHDRRDARDEEADGEDEHELADEQRQPQLDDALLDGRVAHDEGGAEGGEQHAHEHPHEAPGEEALARRARDDDTRGRTGLRDGVTRRHVHGCRKTGPADAGRPCRMAWCSGPFCGWPEVGPRRQVYPARSSRPAGASRPRDCGTLNRVGATAPRRRPRPAPPGAPAPRARRPGG